MVEESCAGTGWEIVEEKDSLFMEFLPGVS